MGSGFDYSAAEVTVVKLASSGKLASSKKSTAPIMVSRDARLTRPSRVRAVRY
jgi:hypothetical protein